MFKGRTKTEGRITVFHLRDDLTTDKVKAFTKKVNSLLDQGRIYLILDLSEVDEACLLGQVAISSLFNKCRQLGGSLKIAGLNRGVKKAFRGTNLANTVEIFENVLDGVKSFRSQNLLDRKAYSGSYFLKEKQAFVGWDQMPNPGYFH